MAHARSEISLREKSAQKNRWQDRPDSHNNTGLYTSTDATRRARTFCKRLYILGKMMNESWVHWRPE
jgi:hypothetical protein